MDHNVGHIFTKQNRVSKSFYLWQVNGNKIIWLCKARICNFSIVIVNSSHSLHPISVTNEFIQNL